MTVEKCTDILKFEEYLNNMQSTYKTKFRLIDAETGKLLYSGENMTILGGRTSSLELLFGLTPNTSKKITLNHASQLNIAHSVDPFASNATVKRTIGYFTIGDGAEQTSLPGREYTPRSYETKLYGIAPFRCVPVASDLSSIVAANYRLRKTITINGNSYYAYYAKKITDVVFNVMFNNAAYTPDISHSRPIGDSDISHPLNGGEVLVYVSFKLNIDKEDYKEYYRLTHSNSLTGAKLSEYGLVIGADAVNASAGNRLELAGAELFSKITHPPVPFSTENSRRVIEYEIYT